jgi:protein-disulfide isomerase-like protein with CxxC motif
VLLAQAGAQGFPTLLLENSRGHMQVLELSHYLGCPQQWLSYLRAELARQASATA